MTIVVLWRPNMATELRCIADTRITRGNATTTDHGPKILPAPVICHATRDGTNWHVRRRTTLGFAFSGSTLSAIGTHSIASACTQHLAAKNNEDRPVSIRAVAELFCKVAEDYMRDLASRLGAVDNPRSVFFEGMIFGYCHATKSLKAFITYPNLVSNEFSMTFGELSTAPGYCHPMGSGADRFVTLNEELSHTHPNPGVLTTIGEMIVQEVQSDVGGHVQMGIADQREGFRLMPILSPGDGGARVSFLGWEPDGAPQFDGYTIGYSAYKIDALWDAANGKN